MSSRIDAIPAALRANIAVDACEFYFNNKITKWIHAKPYQDTELAMQMQLVLEINGDLSNATLDVWESDLGNLNYNVDRIGGNQTFTVSF